MSAKKYTPGPWKACWYEVHDRDTQHGEDGARIGSTANCICTVHFVPAPTDTRKANARLIAAAPEMLEALTQTIRCLSDIANAKEGERWDWDWEAVIRDGEEIIAKALSDA